MKVESTRDYARFKKLEGNRKVRSAHVRRLQNSLKAYPELSQYNPIIVNDKDEVIDGQHTLEAAKQAGLPVYYVVMEGAGLKEVQALNSNAKIWTPVDYALSYSDLGKDNYDFYLEMKSRFGLNHDVLLRYISIDESATPEMFNAGRLKTPNRERSWELAQMLTEVGEYHDRYKLRPFALAFKDLAETRGYSHRQMLGKMQLRGHLLKSLSHRDDYKRELIKIYNWYVPVENKLMMTIS